MSLFSTKRTRKALRRAQEQRNYLIDNAKLQARCAGMHYLDRDNGSVILANKALTAHIIVDPQVNKAGKLVPMISVMTEDVRANCDWDTDVLEINTMNTSPEMTLGRLIHQYA